MSAEKTKKEKKQKSFYAAGQLMESGNPKKFTRTFLAYNEGHARQKLLSLLGSNYGAKRRAVSIEELREGEGI